MAGLDNAEANAAAKRGDVNSGVDYLANHKSSQEAFAYMQDLAKNHPDEYRQTMNAINGRLREDSKSDPSLKDVLGELVIFDGTQPQSGDRPEAAAATARPGDNPAAAPASAPPDSPQSRDTSTAKPNSQWTVAIDLTADSPNPMDPKAPVGGSTKYQQELKQLADQTKNSGVTLDVQYLNPDKSGTLEHYQIKDGQVNQLANTHSKGSAQDIQDLVHTASHDDPSDKIALIVQSHGTGSGIHDGNGNATASMGDVANAIRNGLKGSGHDKLDVLDLDSCLNGTAAVLDQTKNVANNLVASAQMEGAMPGNDGQNLNAALSDLLKNPTQNGSQFANDFVDEAKKGSNGSTGTSTLASYDLSKVNQLDNSLNNLGNTLATLAQDPNNKAILEQDIENATRYGAIMDRDGTKGFDNRDMKQLLNKIKQSLESGQLSDRTGKLAQNLDEALSAENDVVRSSFTSPAEMSGNLDPNTIGDLSLFAPNQDRKNPQAYKDGQNNLPAGWNKFIDAMA